MPVSKSVQKKSEPQQTDTKKTTKTSNTTEPVKGTTVPVQVVSDKKESKTRIQKKNQKTESEKESK